MRLRPRLRPLAALVLTLALPALGLADDEKAKTGEADSKKLQGRWTAKVGADATPVTLAFDKGKVTFTVTAPTGDEKVISGDFALDADASPRAMTWSAMKLGAKSVPGTEAIYAFDGEDTLKIAGGTSKRPSEFIEKGKALPGLRPNTMIFTRVKDEPKE